MQECHGLPSDSRASGAAPCRRSQCVIQSRDNSQSMGLNINEPLVRDRDRLLSHVRAIAEGGYGILRLFFRRSSLRYSSPEVIDAAVAVSREAHRLGMKVAMDFEPHEIFCRELVARHPEARMIKLVRCVGRVDGGRYHLRIPIDGVACCAEPVADGVEAAFLDGSPCDLSGARFSAVCDFYGHGAGVDGLTYTEGAAMRGGRQLWTLSGSLPGAPSGEIVAWYRLSDCGAVDFASPAIREFSTWLLGLYADAGADLDGAGWDEPAMYGDWASLRWGEGLEAEWRESHGGAPFAASLTHFGNDDAASPETIRVRLEYHRVLDVALARAQAHFVSEAARLFGRPMIAGTHHTWQGEGGGNDYRAGASDYFLLGEGMDAGYTDCSWWDPRSVRYSYLLALALARLSPTGEAVANTWHFKPSARDTRDNARLMSLLRITWFNIWVGEDTDTCLFPGHRTWPVQTSEARRHRDFMRATAGAAPLDEIAILHDWHAPCAAGGASFANRHKSLLMNLATEAVERSLPVAFVDAPHISDARIAAATPGSAPDAAPRLDCGKAGDFGVVVVPSAAILPRAAWDKLVAFGRTGGKVVFCGAAPTWDETGADLSLPFAELLGLRSPVPFARHESWLHSNYAPVPEGRALAYDAVFPIEQGGAGRIEDDAEGRPAIAVSPCGAFRWYSGAVPALDVADELCRLWSPPVRVVGDCLHRLFVRGGKLFAAVASRDGRPVDAVLVGADGSMRRIGGAPFLWEECPSRAK